MRDSGPSHDKATQAVNVPLATHRTEDELKVTSHGIQEEDCHPPGTRTVLGAQHPAEVPLMEGEQFWALDSVSANCLETAKEQLLPATSANIVLLQETKTLEDSQSTAARCRLRHCGWNSHTQNATRREGGKPSARCEVAVRKGIELTP